MELKLAMELKRTWTGILAQIRERPGVFIGNSSLQGLAHLCAGLWLAKDLYSVPESRRQIVDDFPWQCFESFVEERYNPHRLSMRSFGMAQFYAQGRNFHDFDPWSTEYPGAWEIWWQWFDEFAAASISPPTAKND